MTANLFEPGWNIRHKTIEGATGTTTGFPVPPPLVALRWNGRWDATAVRADEIEVVGPESPAPDLRACGAGEGGKCCIFLTIGPQGASCERHTELRTVLLIRRQSMNAQRVPVKAYPYCMDTADAAVVPEGEP